MIQTKHEHKRPLEPEVQRELGFTIFEVRVGSEWGDQGCMQHTSVANAVHAININVAMNNKLINIHS